MPELVLWLLLSGPLQHQRHEASETEHRHPVPNGFQSILRLGKSRGRSSCLTKICPQRHQHVRDFSFKTIRTWTTSGVVNDRALHGAVFPASQPLRHRIKIAAWIRHMINGFIILSHSDPHQLRRLVTTLNWVFDHPPVACHHDTSQTAVDTTMFPANVYFVDPPLRTGWGKFSIVEAGLAALELLYGRANPDWFTLLSAADYPIARAADVRAHLDASGADALIDFRETGMSKDEAAATFGPRNPTLGHLEASNNSQMIARRYKGAQIWVPLIRRQPRLRLGRHTFNLPFDTPFHPFNIGYRCYYGDQWFTGSKRAAAALLNPTPEDLRLQSYLRRRAVPDECYYQSVLCNRPGLVLQRETRRYARWNGGGAHPSSLGCSDFDVLASSGAHFARKFLPDDPILDRIDKEILGEVPADRRAPTF